MFYKSLILLTLCQFALPANILYFFPGGNVSHKIGVWPWVLEMATRGHNITFISPHPKTPSPHPNILDHSVKVLHDQSSKVYQVDRFTERETGREMDFNYNILSAATCAAVVNSIPQDPVLTSIFRNGSSFDLVVVNTIFGECGHYVGHYFKAKTITYDSCTMLSWYYDTYGVSPEAAWVPDMLSQFDTYPLSFWDRVRASYYTWLWGTIIYDLSPLLQQAVSPLFPGENPAELPTLYELENSVSFVFLNSHTSFDFARTLPPLFIEIGGMASTASTKPLPTNFKDFMDGSGQGVVLISFGSTVLLNTVPEKYQRYFFHLVASFPNVRFIMRWGGPLPTFLQKKPENLMVSDWLPQKEILSHPKLKAFITHGGVSSIQEATFYGVPMICVPMFADQDYNGYRIQAQEVGLKAEIRGMTESTLVDAVKELMSDDKYKRNMLKKQAIFKDRPVKPVENAVFWSEFALRHEETMSTFRPNNQHLNMLQRRLIDVYAFVLGCALLLIISTLYILKYLTSFVWKHVWSQGQVTPSKKRN